MSEFGNWIPILGLLIPTISLAVAILTYLRVSRKYHSKTLHLSIEIKPRQIQSIFCINGTGSLQRLAITVQGDRSALIALTVDDEVCFRKSLWDLVSESSEYLISAGFSGPDQVGKFTIEVNMPKNFFKTLELLLTNKSENIPIKVNGTLHYDIYEPRFHFGLKKSPAS